MESAFWTSRTTTSIEEFVNDSFSRANNILWELKGNIDPATFVIPPVVLPNNEGAAAYQALLAATQYALVMVLVILPLVG